jgi:heme/copper-type cytochrome/quinol oxidase subunit 1
LAIFWLALSIYRIIQKKKKLIIGLSTLFISIATMMVAFCAALIILLDGKLQIVMPIVFLSGIPVTLFML